MSYAKADLVKIDKHENLEIDKIESKSYTQIFTGFLNNNFSKIDNHANEIVDDNELESNSPAANKEDVELSQINSYELLEINAKIHNIKKQIANSELVIYNESTK